MVGGVERGVVIGKSGWAVFGQDDPKPAVLERVKREAEAGFHGQESRALPRSETDQGKAMEGLGN